LIALNFDPEPAMLDVSADGGRILLSTHVDRAGPLPAGGLRLRGDEGVIVELPPT
jgi:alpha-glucosidase